MGTGTGRDIDVYEARAILEIRNIPYTTCPECGWPITTGTYPFCPHGRYNQQFTIKQGQPTHAYYYRNPDGTIGIPPAPELAPPGVTLERIDDIATARKLSAEMSAHDYEKFQDHGRFTEEMESILGNPRQTLIDQMAHPKSQLERDTIPLLIEELDKEAADRTKISTDVKFEFMGT